MLVPSRPSPPAATVRDPTNLKNAAKLAGAVVDELGYRSVRERAKAEADRLISEYSGPSLRGKTVIIRLEYYDYGNRVPDSIFHPVESRVYISGVGRSYFEAKQAELTPGLKQLPPRGMTYLGGENLVVRMAEPPAEGLPDAAHPTRRGPPEASGRQKGAASRSPERQPNKGEAPISGIERAQRIERAMIIERTA
jgi:hypothetical protein